MQILETRPQARQRRYNDIRVLSVLRTQMLTPKMKRIFVGGDEIAGFGKGPNIKLLFPPAGFREPEWPMAGPDGRAIWPDDARRPAVRTYSVSRFDADAGELAIDFVLHGHDGPAANWALHAKPGDVIGVGGPGGRGLRESGWYLFAGDHCALPAIAHMLADLPASAKGRVFLEIPGPAEEQPLAAPAGIEITWLHRNGRAPGESDLLEKAVRTMEWPDGVPFVWIAGESSAVRALRTYVRDERKIERRQFLAIGYWRKGMSETDYKKAFNNDRDEDYFKGAF